MDIKNHHLTIEAGYPRTESILRTIEVLENQIWMCVCMFRHCKTPTHTHTHMVFPWKITIKHHHIICYYVIYGLNWCVLIIQPLFNSFFSMIDDEPFEKGKFFFPLMIWIQFKSSKLVCVCWSQFFSFFLSKRIMNLFFSSSSSFLFLLIHEWMIINEIVCTPGHNHYYSKICFNLYYDDDNDDNNQKKCAVYSLPFSSLISPYFAQYHLYQM